MVFLSAEINVRAYCMHGSKSEKLVQAFQEILLPENNQL